MAQPHETRRHSAPPISCPAAAKVAGVVDDPLPLPTGIQHREYRKSSLLWRYLYAFMCSLHIQQESNPVFLLVPGSHPLKMATPLSRTRGIKCWLGTQRCLQPVGAPHLPSSQRLDGLLHNACQTNSCPLLGRHAARSQNQLAHQLQRTDILFRDHRAQNIAEPQGRSNTRSSTSGLSATSTFLQTPEGGMVCRMPLGTPRRSNVGSTTSTSLVSLKRAPHKSKAKAGHPQCGPSNENHDFSEKTPDRYAAKNLLFTQPRSFGFAQVRIS